MKFDFLRIKVPVDFSSLMTDILFKDAIYPEVKIPLGFNNPELTRDFHTLKLVGRLQTFEYRYVLHLL